MPSGGSYPVPPSAPQTPQVTPPSGSSGSSGSTGGGSTSGGGSSSGGGGGGSTSGGGGGGGGGYKKKAVRRYMQQVEVLQGQIDAVQSALGSEFKRSLKRRLKNTMRGMREQDALLLEAYDDRIAELEKSATDNEKAAGGQSTMNLTNAARERANALSQLALQGAGETDILLGQQMALRNWAANQSEISTSARDTATSIAASAADLTADTKTARSNVNLQANADREALMNDYFDQREGALMQLGNLYGQQAEILGFAQELINSKKTRRRLKRIKKKSDQAFADMAEASGDAWVNPGVSKKIQKWDGSSVSDTSGAGVPSMQLNDSSPVAIGTPSGAGLREWS
jgi:hypothetical protein